jgi:hypothetical protein
MSGWLCTDSGDVDFTNGQMRNTSGAQEAKQNLAQNLRTFLGEWFLDITLGLPYFQIIFEKGTPIEVIKSYLQEAVLSTKGIADVETLDVELDAQTRKLTVDLVCTYTDGSPVSVVVTL